jgi:hypothetical protein
LHVDGCELGDGRGGFGLLRFIATADEERGGATRDQGDA